MNNIPDQNPDPPDPEIDEDVFHVMLHEIVGEMPTSDILDIPGVYELVSNHFNDKIIELHQERNSERNSLLKKNLRRSK